MPDDELQPNPAKRPRGRPRKHANRTGIPEYTPERSIGWFRDLLGRLAYELAVTRDRDLRQDLKAIAQAGLAAKHLNDVAELEARIASVEQHDREIAAQAAHGSRSERAAPGAREASGPVPPIH